MADSAYSITVRVAESSRHYTDFQNHISNVSEHWTYNDPTYRKTFTNARGKTTYTDHEMVIGAIKTLTHPVDNLGNSATVTFEYTDPANPYYLASKTDERYNTTSYTRYPDTGLTKHMIEQINYPDGGSEHFTYNGFNQVLEHRMTNGGIETFTYTRGLKQTYTPPATSSDPHPEQHPTRYFYYDSGLHTDRLHYVVDPRGNATWYEYNARGLVSKVTHQDNKYILNEYNLDGTLQWTEKDELRHKTRYDATNTSG